MSILYPDLSNTTYPNTVDTFIQFLDIVASDGDLVKQYQIAMQNGDEATANAVLQQIPAYRQKLLTAQDLNKFIVVYKNMYANSEDERYKDEFNLHLKMLKRENTKQKRLILRENYRKI